MLISCIMPTRGRPEFAADAVRQFQRQTWPEKELIILDDPDAPSFTTPPADPQIEYNRCARRWTVGEKRNIAVARSLGGIIAHWDDDDWYSQDRLEDQVQRLLSSNSMLTAYCPVPFTDGVRWWDYCNPRPDYGVGASFMYRREFWRANPFAGRMVAEDDQFLDAARGRVAIAPGRGLMIARIHPGNTSPRDPQGNPKQWVASEAPACV